MKEITRRLYTKPVMLGMVFLVGIALVAALFVTTTKSTAAPSQFPVAAGPDEFETAGDGQTYHDFTGSPIKADFFGTGSKPYGQLVPLVGVPLNPEESLVDTIIDRAQAVGGPGGSTPITMTALSLKAINPITVSYFNSTNTETWEVFVGLSQFKTSGGTMTIHSTTFDSTLKVWPRFTFKRVPDGLTKVLDTGSGSSLTANATVRDFDDGGVVIAPDEPAPLPAPCKIAVAHDTGGVVNSTVSAAAATSCPPVTLTSTASPWGPCAPNTFCITVPITEEERWAKHRPRPKTIIIKAGGVAE